MTHSENKLNACRRILKRNKIGIAPETAYCWTGSDSRKRAVVIEADRKGARLVLPWPVAADEEICVSFGNALGLFRTEKARVAWARPLENSGHSVVGLYYEAC